MTPPGSANRAALLAFVLAFPVLIANGRPIGSGDTHAMERTAQALMERGTVVLPEDNSTDPFTRPIPGGRISIYPALPALLAVPFFLAFGILFDLTPAGLQLAGKLTAALFAASAIAVLARSFAIRTSPPLAVAAALVFGLGTSVFSTAQALWQHPAVLFFLAIALSALEGVDRARGLEPRGAGVLTAVCLSLAAACRPAVIPMCAVLFVFLLQRSPGRRLRLLVAGCVPAVGVALYNATFFGTPWSFGPAVQGRFLAAFPESIVGLLISPGRGLFVFTPVALLSLWVLIEIARRTAFARALLGAVGAHFLLTASWNEWHGGESFGPRLLTDLLPALFYFLPEALASFPRLGVVLSAVSVAIQLLGGWTYDYRWERLHQRGEGFDAALWSFRDSPVRFALREGVLIQGLPDRDGRRMRLGVRRFVPLGPEGSLIEATPAGLRTSGPALVRDVRLERGARLADGWLTLAHPGDALAFRTLRDDARSLRLVGRLLGTLRIEATGRVTSVPVEGDFDVTLPLHVGSGTHVFVRSEAGELKLARVEVRP